ncbi:hypothetical protein Ciccas_001282 [Cichlidogyrus casuarinus]|uniref:Ubiquitinyl hydrolase 1 n=1 Tax=Cichlidogyrus casuarinus TaxID=1844966 RepID=A0ABD2QMR9_9PLAT
MDEENPSLIMDIFQGSLVSTVECLNCNKKSRREETFIDLSVPLVKPTRPKSDQSSMPTVSYIKTTNSTDLFTHLLNLFIFVLFYIRFVPWKVYDYSKKSLDSVFGVSDLHLTDCLDAFFSEDELTGDNRYLCKRCNASCNGTKSTRLLRAPEVLLIHLKRFRTDLISASKLCTSVSFPLTDLDLSPYLFRKKTDGHNDSQLYDLAGIICHLGSSSSCGHYISMAYNHVTRSWLEYDDEIVTEIDPATVISCMSSAYILIYNKQSSHMNSIRKHADKLLSAPTSPDGYYISKAWCMKLNNFADPGPITTHEFLCPHDLLQPTLIEHRKDYILKIPAELWHYLYDKFGCNDPIVRDLTPPGTIDNIKIAETFCAYYSSFQPNINYVLMSEGCWTYLHSIYSGGPKLMLSTGTPENESSQSDVEYPVSEDELKRSSAHNYRSKSVDQSDFEDNADSGLTDTTSMTVETADSNRITKSPSSSAYWSNEEEGGNQEAEAVRVEVEKSKVTNVAMETKNEPRRRKGSDYGRRHGGKRRDRRAR